MGACSNNCILISGGKLICKSIVAYCCLDSQRFSIAPPRRFLPLAHPAVRADTCSLVCDSCMTCREWGLGLCGWKNSNVSVQNSLSLVYRQDVSQCWNRRCVSAKNGWAKPDKVRWHILDGRCLTLSAVLPFPENPSSQFSMPRTWLCVNQAV